MNKDCLLGPSQRRDAPIDYYTHTCNVPIKGIILDTLLILIVLFRVYLMCVERRSVPITCSESIRNQPLALRLKEKRRDSDDDNTSSANN